MKLKWKNLKKHDFRKIKKWKKINPDINKYLSSSIINNESIFFSQGKYIIGNNLFLKKLYYKHRLVGIISFLYNDMELVIDTLIINPKYTNKGFGKAIILDLIKNNVLITNKLINKITAGITSDNHNALKLFKSLDFKLDNIYPDKGYYDFVYHL